MKSALKEILREDKNFFKEVIKEVLDENKWTEGENKKINLKKFSDKILTEENALLDV